MNKSRSHESDLGEHSTLSDSPTEVTLDPGTATGTYESASRKLTPASAFQHLSSQTGTG
jgi:hypothetical protein